MIQSPDRKKALVAIASYGTRNDAHLSKLVDEYRSMSFDTHIVLLSNIDKSKTFPGTETFIVDLRGKDPWSLPFPHKQMFAERLNDYDLFIYSEDDTPITEKNVRAFLEVSETLPENEIVGFLRFEQDPDGGVNYPEMHGHFHWDPQSVRRRGEHTFAYFTNEHSACYILTQRQLKRAIDSGGFLVEPHEGKYDLLCSAATDPYTQCGFQKLICVSRLDDFLIHHLPNKYVGTNFGVDDSELRRQIDWLLKIGQNGHRSERLFQTESKRFAKDHYEPVNPNVVSLLPSAARSVLSIGCGWGATEGWLAERGLSVTAVPIDSVIPGGARAKGVEIIDGDFESARAKLAGRQFDCLLLLNVLHLVHDPVGVLSSFGSLLASGSVAIISAPNLRRLSVIAGRIRGDEGFKDLGNYEATGTHATSHAVVRRWCEAAGLKVLRTTYVIPKRAETVHRLTLGAFSSLWASDLIVAARKT